MAAHAASPSARRTEYICACVWDINISNCRQSTREYKPTTNQNNTYTNTNRSTATTATTANGNKHNKRSHRTEGLLHAHRPVRPHRQQKLSLAVSGITFDYK